MPPSGPVYQPTTVSYEQQGGDWSSQPRSYLSQTVKRVNNPKCVQWSLLVVGFMSLAIGFILFMEGTVFSDSRKSSDDPEIEAGSSIALVITGIILIVIGIVLIIACARLVYRRLSWFNDRRFPEELDAQNRSGPILTTLNPSTDLLVTSSQYSTVNEAPPTLLEVEETRKLMGNDNKDCTEDNERMLDTDPRIVLRPLSNPEDA